MFFFSSGSQNRQWPNAAASEIGRQTRRRSTLLYSNDMYRTSSGNNRDIGQIVWGDAQQEAFEKIIVLIASAPVLARPAFDAQFVVQTDASDTGIGAVLHQVIDGQESAAVRQPHAVSSGA